MLQPSTNAHLLTHTRGSYLVFLSSLMPWVYTFPLYPACPFQSLHAAPRHFISFTLNLIRSRNYIFCLDVIVQSTLLLPLPPTHTHTPVASRVLPSPINFLTPPFQKNRTRSPQDNKCKSVEQHVIFAVRSYQDFIAWYMTIHLYG